MNQYYTLHDHSVIQMTDSPMLQRSQIFPRSRLASGESLLWEGRPSSIVYFVQPLILFILTLIFGLVLTLNYGAVGAMNADISVWAVLAVLLLLMPSAENRMGVAALVLGVAVIITDIAGLFGNGVISFLPAAVGLFAFLWDYVVWTHTAFAITDRRIMTQYGVFNIRFGDTRHERISNVTEHQTLLERALGFGDVMFSTSGETGGIDSDNPALQADQRGAVRWDDIPNPFYVRKRAEEAMLNPSWQNVRVQAPPAYVPAQLPPQPISPVEAEERLVKLRELLEKGLISKEEYESKRREIVSRL